MAKCFRIQGVNCVGVAFDVYEGGYDSISTTSGGCGVIFVLNGVPRGDLGSNQSASISQVDCSFCGGGAGCEEPQRDSFDCINGACIPSSIYNTPGAYSSIEECQSNCGTNANPCPEGYECVSIEDTQKLKDCLC